MAYFGTGKFYVGEFNDHKNFKCRPNGKGEILDAEENLIFRGRFFNGKKHGDGYLYENKKMIYGYWEDDELKEELSNKIYSAQVLLTPKRKLEVI